MEIRNDFRLRFMTDRNELKTINIPRALASATGLQISAAMQSIVDSGVVQSARGEPLSGYSAELVTTERKDFEI
jgi:hypothetical protein